MNTDPIVAIHPQKCHDCDRQLVDGETAVASMDFPLAFCMECRGKAQETHPRLCRAIVKAESSG